MSQAVDLPRRLAAEALGTAILVATVVGSGVMAESLTRDVALQLLCNALATGAILIVLITILGPISGAQFNPVVTGALALSGAHDRREILPYVAAQAAGGCAGTILAHLMFGLPAVELSIKARTGAGQWLAEAVAAFGLVATILIALRLNRAAIPMLVGLYITSAYWFTASTSFANPAVTMARALTPSFAGIAPADVPAFVVAQIAGALAATGLAGWLLARRRED